MLSRNNSYPQPIPKISSYFFSGMGWQKNEFLIHMKRFFSKSVKQISSSSTLCAILKLLLSGVMNLGSILITLLLVPYWSHSSGEISDFLQFNQHWNFCPGIYVGCKSVTWKKWIWFQVHYHPSCFKMILYCLVFRKKYPFSHQLIIHTVHQKSQKRIKTLLKSYYWIKSLSPYLR